MNLKEQARALELLRKLVEHAKTIDSLTDFKGRPLTEEERGELFGAIGRLLFWSDAAELFLRLSGTSAPSVSV